MTTTNEITGDKLQTKPNSNKYRDNYDAIFGSKEMKVTSNKITYEDRPNNDGVVGGGSSNNEYEGV